jgi:hypothetical protein
MESPVILRAVLSVVLVVSASVGCRQDSGVSVDDGTPRAATAPPTAPPTDDGMNNDTSTTVVPAIEPSALQKQLQTSLDELVKTLDLNEVFQRAPAVVPLNTFGLETIGKREWVEAIGSLGCQANWDGIRAATCSQSSVWSPLRGYAIMQTATSVMNSNNGGHQVSVLAGGLDLAVEQSLDMAYDELIDFAAKSGQDDAKARLEAKKTTHKRLAERYRSTHNAVHATVNASTHGTVIDRKGGSIAISVRAEVIYIGENDIEALKQVAAAETGLGLRSK